MTNERRITIDEHWITVAEDHLAERYLTDKCHRGEANHAAFIGYTEALRMLGLNYNINSKGEATIWDPDAAE
ncbi:MAG: hypothetical protein LKE48_02790 [Solobacterium sp.]|jgi:hypothetical protein|nr:hypothetical protein [Solobacterium sp.]